LGAVPTPQGGDPVGDVRVLVAVPYPLLQEGIKLALSGARISVVAEATDASSAAAAAASTRPDACLVDLDLHGGGIPAVRAITNAYRRTTVIMLADRYGQPDIVDAVRAGAAGFLDKDIESASLANAIMAAIGGEAVVPRRLVARLVHEVRAQTAERRSGWSPVDLTRREFEVLDLMREGLNTSGIAERLFVSPGTVRSHVMSMMHKLHVGDRESLLESAGGPGWRPPALAQ
jgi:DNA-binding NarL/FixJ family response regulator